MDDTTQDGPDLAGLFQTATGQHGYFTTAQALEHGVGGSLLTYHTRTGRFIRIQRGLYRFRDYPSFYREDVLAAWLAVGKEIAVVSHESALDLLELSDVIPHGVHLTVPRAKRSVTVPPGVRLHTTTRPLTPSDVTIREGIKVTSPVRTILDAAEWGTAPNQIELAVWQALDRAIMSRRQIEGVVGKRQGRVRRLIAGALNQAPT